MQSEAVEGNVLAHLGPAKDALAQGTVHSTGGNSPSGRGSSRGSGAGGGGWSISRCGGVVDARHIQNDSCAAHIGEIGDGAKVLRMSSARRSGQCSECKSFCPSHSHGHITHIMHCLPGDTARPLLPVRTMICI